MEQDDQLLTIQQNLTTSKHFLYEEWPTWPFTRLTPRQFDYLETKRLKKEKVDKLVRIINAEEAPF